MSPVIFDSLWDVFCWFVGFFGHWFMFANGSAWNAERPTQDEAGL